MYIGGIINELNNIIMCNETAVTVVSTSPVRLEKVDKLMQVLRSVWKRLLKPVYFFG